MSGAGVTLANGLNANQVRRWMRERGVEPPSRRGSEAVTVSDVARACFVPVTLAPTSEPVIRLVRACLVLERLHAWLLARRTQVPIGSAIARALGSRPASAR
ncbi:hypothetical protein [Aromatoleum buckelii]|uniref:Transposase n=1 Tax=Aromatoleum buckelii TaxID=200254 RepID=A0ABX1N5Z6_9RHOO|nr:hypothetical protein [Aromatoleum buckelii]MCK0509664.1 hypothetical protein [Aromatoleum buckelii]